MSDDRNGEIADERRPLITSAIAEATTGRAG